MSKTKQQKQNCTEIEIIVKTAFDWAASNNVKFDDDKSELIHFEKRRNLSKDTLQLPNGTILEPKNVVFFYLFIKCIQPKVMTLNYFKIWFYFTNKSTLYNPTIYRQYCPVFTPC